ncbi:MAG: glycosyltransferase [Clostridia bacterium]|nr:glycosyltransferase [Clostridia bacterium]
MNLQSDVVFANQSDETGYREVSFGENTARMISTATRGVGVNRNLALLYATGEYLLFSDDDLRYVDGYRDTVERAFSELPRADCIIFNIETVGSDIGRRQNGKARRVRWYNALNYGAVRLAVRRSSVSREGIFFNCNFGGGTPFSCGEDTLYIISMLKKGLKLYAYPALIATVDQTESTWFRGYTEKYYFDKGVLYASISRPFGRLLCLQDLIRHPNYKKNGLSFSRAYAWMKRGLKSQKRLTPFSEAEK